MQNVCMELEFPSFSSSGVGLGMLQKKGKLIRVTFTEVWQLLLRSALAPSKWIVESLSGRIVGPSDRQHISLRTIFLSGDAKLGSVWVSSYWLIRLLFPQASIFPSVFLSTVVPEILLKKKDSTLRFVWEPWQNMDPFTVCTTRVCYTPVMYQTLFFRWVRVVSILQNNSPWRKKISSLMHLGNVYSLLRDSY